MSNVIPLRVPARLLSTTIREDVGFDIELPAELEDALDGGALRQAFYTLSTVQKDCYAEWVGADPTEDGRRTRAGLVCSVVRRLVA